MSDEIKYIDGTYIIQQDRQDISECFESAGISPTKVYAHPLSGRVNLGKGKCWGIKCNTKRN